MSCLEQYGTNIKSTSLNIYACNVAVDENEDHKPSIEKCTQYDKWPKMKRINRCRSLGKREYLDK